MQAEPTIGYCNTAELTHACNRSMNMELATQKRREAAPHRSLTGSAATPIRVKQHVLAALASQPAQRFAVAHVSAAYRPSDRNA